MLLLVCIWRKVNSWILWHLSITAADSSLVPPESHSYGAPLKGGQSQVCAFLLLRLDVCQKFRRQKNTSGSAWLLSRGLISANRKTAGAESDSLLLLIQSLCQHWCLCVRTDHRTVWTQLLCCLLYLYFIENFCYSCCWNSLRLGTRPLLPERFCNSLSGRNSPALSTDCTSSGAVHTQLRKSSFESLRVQKCFTFSRCQSTFHNLWFHVGETLRILPIAE